MPIYEYKCKCGEGCEVFQTGGTLALCPKCNVEMERQFSRLAFVKNKGEGGYPSRQKFFKGSAPFSQGNGVVPWLDKDPVTTYKNHNWDGKELDVGA